MKKVSLIIALALIAASSFYNQVSAGCECNGTPTGVCATEYGSTTGFKLCYTGPGGDCTGTSYNESLD
jgi:hypothetical protein